jgi:hypothetical protein
MKLNKKKIKILVVYPLLKADERNKRQYLLEQATALKAVPV